MVAFSAHYSGYNNGNKLFNSHVFSNRILACRWTAAVDKIDLINSNVTTISISDYSHECQVERLKASADCNFCLYPFVNIWTYKQREFNAYNIPEIWRKWVKKTISVIKRTWGIKQTSLEIAIPREVKIALLLKIAGWFEIGRHRIKRLQW